LKEKNPNVLEKAKLPFSPFGHVTVNGFTVSIDPQKKIVVVVAAVAVAVAVVKPRTK